MQTTKERYAKLKAANICIRCGANQAEPGSVSCRSCSDTVNARRVGRAKPPSSYSSGGSFNVCCQATGFHRIDCKEAKMARPRTKTLAPQGEREPDDH
jgi:hypothetical protein